MNILNYDDYLNEAEKSVKWRKWDCTVKKSKYNNNRVALELLDKKTGEPVLTATVNIPGADIGADEVIIKNYSENEGILDALIAAKIVSEPKKSVRSGMIDAPVCKLLI